MKKWFTLALLFFSLAANTLAQDYSSIKWKYDSREYVKEYNDPYNPTLSGICSFVIPGLGQMIDEEPERGLGFLAGSIGCSLVFGTGFILTIGSALDGSGNSQISTSTATNIMLAGLAGMVAVDLWSVFDAVKVAKIKNMYSQDQWGKRVGLEISPYVEPLTLNHRREVPLGLTLRVSF